VTVVLVATPAGFAAGTALALCLDLLYTGAPLRGPLSPCAGRPAVLWWTGTLGYLLARGRCHTGTPLPARLWYLPLVGGAAGALIALRATDARHAALTALFSLILLAFVGTDFERHLLPNRLMYPALALAVAVCWAWPDRGPLQSVAGGLLGFGLLLVVFLVRPGLGFGDVKLGGLIGLVTGLSHTLAALALGAVAGGVGAALMLATRRARFRATVAYGPYLALGAFLVMLGG
jgi:leader peptidase (prepilin peptidase)/N-methyltransferase